MLVKVPTSILNLPWFQLGRQYKKNSYTLENEQIQFTCSAGDRLPSWGEMDLILFLFFQHQKKEYSFTMKECLNFLNKKCGKSVLKALRNLSQTTYRIKKDKDKIFNLIKLKEIGAYRNKRYTFELEENIFDESFQMIDIKKYLSLPAGYTRRFFLYLEKYRRLKKSYLKLKDIEFWACLVTGDEKKHHNQIKRTLSKLRSVGFLNGVEEDNLKRSYRIYYDNGFHKEQDKPEPEKPNLEGCHKCSKLPKEGGFTDWNITPDGKKFCEDCFNPQKLTYTKEFSQVVYWEDAERFQEQKKKESLISKEERQKIKEFTAKEKQTEIHDFVEKDDISLDEKMEMLDNFEEMEDDMSIREDIAKRAEEKRKARQEQEKKKREEITPEEQAQKMLNLTPQQQEKYLKFLELKKEKEIDNKFSFSEISKEPKNPKDCGEMDAIPDIWDNFLEENYLKKGEEISRWDFYRKYGSDLLLEKELSERKEEKRDQIIVGSFAEKKETFDQKYPTMTMQEIQKWIQNNLHGCQMTATQMAQRYFANNQDDFCNYFSKHLVPSFDARKNTEAPITVAIAIIKIKSHEQFNIVGAGQ